MTPSGTVRIAQAQSQQSTPSASGKKPNILVIFGDDIGQSNISAYTFGLMGYKTPNIDRIAREGLMFTDYYAEQSCTAGRSSFITGQSVIRTGLSKVGIPGATVGLQPEDITIAEALKPLGYATGQFGKNHLGDRNEYLPTVHGFDEFSATSTTSMPRKTQRTLIIRRTQRSRPSLGRAAYSGPKPRRALAKSASRPSRTRVH
jgi:arylsulfatase A-like enzyme